MKWSIISHLVVLLIKQIGPDQLESVADKGLDYIEDTFSENKPAMATCNLIRATFNIEDND